ncbi:MAG: Holliday junction branch migration protein RuvA [Zetaproteobacteria bacterium]|nr:MAG: Holliday junction branch migration protein RuvA [Zetaproteobacteria bacterium]
MIGWLRGRIRELDADGCLLIETDAGIGYEVTVPTRTLAALRPGAECALFVHTHVREDQLLLFGFATISERTLFRRLTALSGVGARTAINMLSAMTPTQLLDAVETGDAAALARTPGVGKKTAQRIILELRGKLTDTTVPAGQQGRDHADLRSALTNLGYKPAAIQQAMRTVELCGEFEEDFKRVLRVLS